MIYLNNVDPSALYRYFDSEEHADAFAAGKVWISTLDTCRKHEGLQRGDPGEATVTYNTGFIRGDGDDLAIQLIASRIKVSVAPGARNITLSNDTAFHRLADAWVLCCTERHQPDGLKGIGQYCVKIEQPREFFEKLTRTFSQYAQIQEAMFGRVIYAERSYQSLEAEPGPIGFVKPPDTYSDQSEVRMLWVPASREVIAPRLVDGALHELCTRIS
jgi:hypothetical protein